MEPLEIALGEETSFRPFSLPETFERAVGCVLLAVSSPVIVASALAVAAFSGRSPFIAHLRVGKHGFPFWVLKLRTLWPNGEPSGDGSGWIERVVADPEEDGKVPGDPRISSRFAAFCRRHSIDELPQLWHVARGQMSLVGPRPLTRGEVLRYYKAHAWELLSVKPGLTGLWQVYGRSAIRFPERAEMDLRLVRTLTARLYLKTLARTVPAVIRGSGAW
jgi:lipopolysaccharide/colanic/teichoic acid biosynthesis glycosyltransferase